MKFEVKGWRLRGVVEVKGWRLRGVVEVKGWRWRLRGLVCA